METERYFTREGPVVPQEHYLIPPLERVDLDEILTLVRRMKYFVVHAPRQTGKTSTLLALADHLNRSGRYRCLYVNFKPGQAAGEDVESAMRTLLTELGTRARTALQDTFVDSVRSELLEECGPHAALGEALLRWSERSPKPLVLMIDEIDTLIGATLISVLRQLRSEYDLRPRNFPQSVILCGVRDMRDYRIKTGSGEVVYGGSAFNIKAESLRLADFTEKEVRSLLGQHVAETGQQFPEEALAAFWDWTRGQPWLVNALAFEACFRDKEGQDRSRPISLEDMQRARESLIRRCDTHIDQLIRQLGTARVRRVIEPLLSGGKPDFRDDDIQYARDLGLLAPRPPPAVANPIYREVIPRALTSDIQESITNETSRYVGGDGR